MYGEIWLALILIAYVGLEEETVAIVSIKVPPWCRSHCRCLIPGCINQWICKKHRTRASTDRDWRTKKGTSSRGHVNSNDGTVKRILDVECYWEQCLQYTMSMTLYWVVCMKPRIRLKIDSAIFKLDGAETVTYTWSTCRLLHCHAPVNTHEEQTMTGGDRGESSQFLILACF